MGAGASRIAAQARRRLRDRGRAAPRMRLGSWRGCEWRPERAGSAHAAAQTGRRAGRRTGEGPRGPKAPRAGGAAGAARSRAGGAANAARPSAGAASGGRSRAGSANAAAQAGRRVGHRTGAGGANPRRRRRAARRERRSDVRVARRRRLGDWQGWSLWSVDRPQAVKARAGQKRSWACAGAHGPPQRWRRTLPVPQARGREREGDPGDRQCARSIAAAAGRDGAGRTEAEMGMRWRAWPTAAVAARPPGFAGEGAGEGRRSRRLAGALGALRRLRSATAQAETPSGMGHARVRLACRSGASLAIRPLAGGRARAAAGILGIANAMGRVGRRPCRQGRAAKAAEAAIRPLAGDRAGAMSEALGASGRLRAATATAQAETPSGMGHARVRLACRSGASLAFRPCRRGGCAVRSGN